MSFDQTRMRSSERSNKGNPLSRYGFESSTQRALELSSLRKQLKELEIRRELLLVEEESLRQSRDLEQSLPLIMPQASGRRILTVIESPDLVCLEIDDVPAFCNVAQYERMAKHRPCMAAVNTMFDNNDMFNHINEDAEFCLRSFGQQ